MRSSTARARAETAVANACKTAGVSPVPAVVVRGSGGAALLCGEHPVIRIGRRLALGEPAWLRWVAAHEVAHIDHGDPHRAREAAALTGAQQVRGVAFLACAFLVAFGAAALTYLALGVDPAVVYAGCVTLVPFAVLAQRLGFRRQAAAGLDHQWVELRADLRAVQLIGHETAIAGLLRHGRFQRAMDSVAFLTGRTHPPTPLRCDAMRAYDPQEDPGTAAARALGKRVGSEPQRNSRWR